MVSAMQAGPCRSPLNSPSSSCSPSPPGRPRPPGGGAHLCFFFKFSSEDRSTFWASHSRGSFILRAGSVSMGGAFLWPSFLVALFFLSFTFCYFLPHPCFNFILLVICVVAMLHQPCSFFFQLDLHFHGCFPVCESSHSFSFFPFFFCVAHGGHRRIV